MVTAALKPVRYEPAARSRSEKSLLARTRTANVEIALCAMAKAFLGTKTSSFTLAILEERTAIFGHPPGTGGDMGALPDEKDEL